MAKMEQILYVGVSIGYIGVQRVYNIYSFLHNPVWTVATGVYKATNDNKTFSQEVALT